jgi:hypothetical protein
MIRREQFRSNARERCIVRDVPGRELIEDWTGPDEPYLLGNNVRHRHRRPGQPGALTGEFKGDGASYEIEYHVEPR